MACSSKAITDADLKSPFKGESDCMWLVGMDSSKLAFRCLRLATMLMDVKSSKHHLLVVSIVDDDQKEDLTLQANCQEEARRCGLLMKNYAFKTMKRPDKWTVGEALIYFANKAAGYKARLVIGAQGMRGGDASKGAQAMDRIGSIASDCMSKVKVPLIVVKQPWGDIDGQRNALGRVMRCGRNGVPGLTFMCCVDGSAISNQIFAFTTSLLRPDDRFVALHVRKVARDVDGQNREAMVCTYYKQECAKVAFTFKGLKGTSFKVQPRNCNTVAEDILDAIEEEMVDVVVMGSVELSNPKNMHQVGSVCAHVAKHSTSAHVCIVKNVSLTG